MPVAMACEQERELRSVVIDAQLRRSDHLYLEVLMAVLAAGVGLDGNADVERDA